MSFYALSDLHLHDDEQPFLFTNKKEAVFVSVVNHLLAEGSTLILAGDTLDLTGMNPPRVGLAEFFAEILPPSALSTTEIQTAQQWRPLADQLNALQRRFPAFFTALGKLAASRLLIVIPGNHDCHLNSREGHREFSRILGVGESDVQWMDQFESNGFLLSLHGHEFDLANCTDRGCDNPGSAMTSVLYRAVMPSLRALGVPQMVVAAIPAVRPEEETVRGIEQLLGETQTRLFLLAFVRLLLKNGYFIGTKKWLLNGLLHTMPGIAHRYITPTRVRAALPDETHLKLAARRGARTIRGSHRVVFMGHTHELDLLPDYVNLGTWIDHITGISPEKIAQAEQTLPLLCIRENQTAVLWDVRRLQEHGLVLNCPELWNYPSRIS